METFPAKGQWHGALMFSLICAWINGWVNNREAVDLRRYRAHYDITVMEWNALTSKRNRYTLRVIVQHDAESFQITCKVLYVRALWQPIYAQVLLPFVLLCVVYRCNTSLSRYPEYSQDIIFPYKSTIVLPVPFKYLYMTILCMQVLGAMLEH